MSTIEDGFAEGEDAAPPKKEVSVKSTTPIKMSPSRAKMALSISEPLLADLHEDVVLPDFAQEAMDVKRKSMLGREEKDMSTPVNRDLMVPLPHPIEVSPIFDKEHNIPQAPGSELAAQSPMMASSPVSLSEKSLSAQRIYEKPKLQIQTKSHEDLENTPPKINQSLSDTDNWEAQGGLKSPILSSSSVAASATTATSPNAPRVIEDEKKIELLLQSYQKVKLYSIQVMKCCDKLKTVVQDGRIGLLQEFVSHFRMVRDALKKFIDYTTSVVTSLDLRRNGVEMLKYEILMTTEFLLGNGTSPNAEEFRKLFGNMNINIDNVMRKYQPASKMMIKSVAGFKEESCYDNAYFIPEEVAYDKVVLEHVADCHYFRSSFLGREHVVFAGTVEKWGPVIISVLREENVESPRSPGERETIFRVIVRFKEVGSGSYSVQQPERREIFYSSQVKKSFLGRKPSIKQVLQLLDADINFSKLKSKDADRHLDARLISLDEFRYKFGLVLCKPGQTTDNEYFSNVSGSEAYETFLASIARVTKLQGFKGFVGGLDTVHGKTGENFLYSKWRDYEIMFHCSTLLPFNKDDNQQIERKRHIGNDIINIIYQDGDMQFDPTSIKTQFTHVYIIVKQETINNADGTATVGYRIAISSSVDVPKFGPPLPNPPVFTDLGRMEQFLMAKLVNAENAALKAPKFSKPNDRAHHALFDDIVEEVTSAGRKDSKKSSDSPDPPLSPLARMFSFTSSKKALKKEVNSGSLNELNLNGAKSSKFVRDGPKSPLSKPETATPRTEAPVVTPSSSTPIKPSPLVQTHSNRNMTEQISTDLMTAQTMKDPSPLASRFAET
ncbi:Rap1 GTPase-activating protein 2 [Kappamyces sp. JEL0829]|nr:Rap1 GTPase-activating protein 2 [Kappamyces sp. JEL0829]